jgi:HEAT repeat protein
VRARAAAVIAETAAPGYGPALVQLLQDTNPDVRLAAAGALGAGGYKVGVAPLTLLLADVKQPVEVRIAATRSLARLAAAEAIDALTAVLEAPPTKDTAQLRQAAAVALGALPEREAFVELTKHLDPAYETDVQVRALAAQSLAGAAKAGTEPTQMAGEALVLAVREDKESDVRIAAAHSLTQMRFSGPLNGQVEEALKTAQNDPHYWVRQAVSETQ